jgi:hypothetical protein
MSTFWSAVLAALLAAAAPAPESKPSADFHFAQGRLAAAEAALGASVGDPRSGVVSCRLALLAGRLETARACFATLFAAAPGDRKLGGQLAATLVRMDRTAEAATVFEAIGQAGRAAEWRAVGRPYRVASAGRAMIVPFVRTDPLPVVKARLNGGPERYFILDTGAAETVLDPTVAAEAGVREAGADKGVFAGGKTAGVRFGVLDRLALGRVTVREAPVMLLPTTGFSEAAGGLPISGVIGVGLLSRFRFTLDYPKGRLVLEAVGSRSAVPAGATTARLWWAGDHYLLAEGAVEGRPELMFLDTGLAGLACTAPASTLAETGLTPKGSETTGVGGGGVSTARAFEARLTLAGVTQEHAPCVAGPFPASLETSLGPRVGVLVSHGFLRNYAATFDTRTMLLILSATSSFGTSP